MVWIKRIFITLVCLGVLLVATVFLATTKTRPVPERVAGFYKTQVRVPHRDVLLATQVWYPTDDTSDAPDLIAQNALFYGTYAQRDAVPADGTYPVVVVSHGSGGNGPSLGWIASKLALAGMIVVTTNHPGTTSGDSDPFRTIDIWERPQDLTAVLDWVSQDPLIGAHVDPQKVGVMGFSFGGHSALSLSGLRVSKQKFIDYCDANRGLLDCGWMQNAGVDFATIDQARYEASYKDARIKASVAIDPALPRAAVMDSLAAVDHPTLIVNLGDPGTTPTGMRADDIALALPQGEYKTVAGSWHFSFLAECSAMGRFIIGVSSPENICSDAGLRARADVHADLEALIVPFFANHLRDAP